MAEDFPIVFTLFPGVTQLDFTGPYEVLIRLPGARAILATSTGGTLEAEGGITFANIAKLSDIESCALVCVPGGFGTIEAMEDAVYLSELKRLATGARWVTSACTGSLLLGAAGLLQGKRAACHWAWRELLSQFGATPDPARMVRDGNVFSGGGVTAGIDMALTVMAEIAGRDHAEAVQLGMEYAPAPPFQSGRPELARPEILERVRRSMDRVRTRRVAAAERAGARLES